MTCTPLLGCMVIRDIGVMLAAWNAGRVSALPMPMRANVIGYQA